MKQVRYTATNFKDFGVIQFGRSRQYENPIHIHINCVLTGAMLAMPELEKWTFSMYKTPRRLCKHTATATAKVFDCSNHHCQSKSYFVSKLPAHRCNKNIPATLGRLSILQNHCLLLKTFKTGWLAPSLTKHLTFNSMDW